MLSERICRLVAVGSIAATAAVVVVAIAVVVSAARW